MSLLRHFYYELKPYLPGRFRLFIRRRLASHLLPKSKNIWPISSSAGKAPATWTEWPEGKRFAFVLTHDVEGPAGLSKCLELMKLEKEMGFRSCFNFIPEGPYDTPDLMRRELCDNGFEVGVHDLKHDGKLYRSRQEFLEHAERINCHLKQWGAVGFRSGFMHHNLEWLHALEIEYDMSTFDTDPFEPQPNGQDTIFPFWVQDPSSVPRRSTSHGGYVELPYTLAQDSTLFLILQQRSIDIWKTKLDWIVGCGGMALLDVHPDYISFDGGQSAFSYPASRYREFLAYVSERYQGEYWHALPRDVARFYNTRRCAAKVMASAC